MSGKGAKYTRAHKPVEIVYTACFDTKSEAMKEEHRFKEMTRKEKLEFLNRGEDAKMQRCKEMQ